MATPTLTISRARRLAVLAQLHSATRPRTVLEIVRELGGLQIDPTSAVARTEQLELWSRLGRYDIAELERLIHVERELFEYRAFIYPVSDFAIHREGMRQFPNGHQKWAHYARTWMETNAELRRHVLASLRRRGPLRTSDFEDRAVQSWRSGGWNEGKNVSRMLELLWAQGRIAIAGRDKNERLWDLAERILPVAQPRLSPPQLARRVLEMQLRRRGIARISQFGFLLYDRPRGWERALQELVREGRAVPVHVQGLASDWFAHAELLEQRFRPRTTLLSPFDKLIANRERTEELFGFRYRLEIYVPKGKREYGYFVLPILHGDRLIGRIDPLFDRKAGVLRINTVYAEPDAPANAWPSVRRAIDDLAGWLGADEVTFPRLPSPWR